MYTGNINSQVHLIFLWTDTESSEKKNLKKIAKYPWIDSSTLHYHFTIIERFNSICKTQHILLEEMLHQNYILLIKINVSINFKWSCLRERNPHMFWLAGRESAL